MGKKFKIKKVPKLVKGTDIGYEIAEIKSLPINDLKNILEEIEFYFNKNTRQKHHNINFKNLYFRIKNELKERRIKCSENKNISPNKLKEITSINEITIPDFFNDKSIIISSNNTTFYLDSSYEESSLKEEIKKLKQEKETLLFEVKILKKNEEEKYNINNNTDYYDEFLFNCSPIKSQDFDLENDIFINNEKNRNLFGDDNLILENI
jgi:hypothetical protein